MHDTYEISVQFEFFWAMTGFLVYDKDPCSIGFIEEKDGDDVYYPVILFNFKVISYISGPGTSYRGYEIKINTTDGPSWIVPIEVTATSSWKRFHEAVRTSTWGAELCTNEFEESLWSSLFNRINFECRKSGIRKNKRPALNLGIQYKYLEEIRKKMGKFYWMRWKESIQI